MPFYSILFHQLLFEKVNTTCSDEKLVRLSPMTWKWSNICRVKLVELHTGRLCIYWPQLGDTTLIIIQSLFTAIMSAIMLNVAAPKMRQWQIFRDERSSFFASKSTIGIPWFNISWRNNVLIKFWTKEFCNFC